MSLLPACNFFLSTDCLYNCVVCSDYSGVQGNEREIADAMDQMNLLLTLAKVCQT